jgi:hypothetical protein
MFESNVARPWLTISKGFCAPPSTICPMRALPVRVPSLNVGPEMLDVLETRCRRS